MPIEHTTTREPPHCACNGQAMAPLSPPPDSDGRETGYELFGDWSPLSEGGWAVNAYRCSSCGRVEFCGPQGSPAG